MVGDQKKISMAKLEKIDEHKLLTDFGLNRHLTNQEREMLNQETKKVITEKGNERYLKFFEVDMLCRKHGLSEKERLDRLRELAKVTPDTVTLPDGTRYKSKKFLGSYGAGILDVMIYDSHQDIAYQRLQAQGRLPIRPPISLKKYPMESRLKYLDRVLIAPFSNILWNPVIFYNDPEYEYTIQARYWSQKFGNKEFLIHKKTLAFIIFMCLIVPTWSTLEDVLVSKDPDSWYRKNFHRKSFFDFANSQEEKMFEKVGYTTHGLNSIGIFPASPLNPINVKELEIDPDKPGLRRFPIDIIENYFGRPEFIHYNRNISLDQATRVAQFGERPDHNRRLLVTYESMKNMLANGDLDFFERCKISATIKRIEEHLPGLGTLEDIEEKLKRQDEKCRREPSLKSKLIAVSTIPLFICSAIATWKIRQAQSMIDLPANQRVDWKVSLSPITTMNHMRTLSIRDQSIIKLVRRYPKLAYLYTQLWSIIPAIPFCFILFYWPTKYFRDGWMEYGSVGLSNIVRDWTSYTTTDKDLEYWWTELNRNEVVSVDDIHASDDYLYFYDQGGPVLKSDQELIQCNTIMNSVFDLV